MPIMHSCLICTHHALSLIQSPIMHSPSFVLTRRERCLCSSLQNQGLHGTNQQVRCRGRTGRYCQRKTCFQVQCAREGEDCARARSRQKRSPATFVRSYPTGWADTTAGYQAAGHLQGILINVRVRCPCLLCCVAAVFRPASSSPPSRESDYRAQQGTAPFIAYYAMKAVLSAQTSR